MRLQAITFLPMGPTMSNQGDPTKGAGPNGGNTAEVSSSATILSENSKTVKLVTTNPSRADKATGKTMKNQFETANQPESSVPTNAKQHRRRFNSVIRYKEPARLVHQVNKKSREFVNHSYHDLSEVLPEPDDLIKTEDDLMKMDIESMSFNEKVYSILMKPEYQRWISFLPHGRAFVVILPIAFEKEVCLPYFGHKRYSSFLRQLNNYGYRHISQGKDRNAYYHEVRSPDIFELLPEISI